MKPFALLILLFSASILHFSCNKSDEIAPDSSNNSSEKGIVMLNMRHFFNTDTFRLLTQNYVNDHGDTLNFEIFKYYMSNFKLKKSDGTWVYMPETYFLIDEADADTKSFGIDSVPAGNYTEISFILGVDSIRNTSGAQTGALDPINGMFWDWNSGYLFVKLDGTSPQSPFGDFVYHLGGYKKPTNCIRWLTFNFNGNTATVGASKTPSLFFNVDVAEFFKNPQTIDVSQIHHVTGGNDLLTLVDNYVDMWTFDHIEQ